MEVTGARRMTIQGCELGSEAEVRRCPGLALGPEAGLRGPRSKRKGTGQNREPGCLWLQPGPRQGHRDLGLCPALARAS